MKVLFLGFGHCADALVRRAPEIEAYGTARSGEKVAALRVAGVRAFVFGGQRAGPGLLGVIGNVQAIVVSIPPNGEGALVAIGEAISKAAGLRRIVYYSTVGVYGQYDGAWVTEESEVRTTSSRSLARLAEERRWTEAGRARGVEVDILRLPGIYGPGRNALVRLREGTRRIVKPGHVTNRAHVDDIAEITWQVLTKGLPGQVWNVADDDPAPPQDVILYAAELLGVNPPAEEAYDPATMTDMAASFFADEKRVSNAKAKALLGFAPRYPTYREGLRALFAAGEGGGQIRSLASRDGIA